MQHPIKPRVGPGPDVHSGPYSKLSQKFKYFDELNYIMRTYKSVFVGNVSFVSFNILGKTFFPAVFTIFIKKNFHFIAISTRNP